MVYQLGISHERPSERYTIHQGRIYRWEAVFIGNKITHYKWTEDTPNIFHIQWMEGKLKDISKQKDKAVADYIDSRVDLL